MPLDNITQILQESFSQLGRVISSSLTATDRQRVNITSTSIFYHGPLNSADWVLLYETSENTRSEIKEINLALGQGVVDAGVDFCLTPKGESPGDDHIVFPGVTLPPPDSDESWRTLNLNTSLIGGWMIHAKSSGNVILHISGTEIVN